MLFMSTRFILKICNIIFFREIASEAYKCLDKYVENAKITGGNLQQAKIRKANAIRDIISSWQPLSFKDDLTNKHSHFEE